MPLAFSHRFVQEETVLFSAKLKNSIFYIDSLCQQIDKGESFAKNGIKLQKVQEHLNVISSEFGSCSKALDDKWVLINCVLLVLCDFYDKTDNINSNHSSLSAQLRFDIKNHLKIVMDSCKEDSLKTIIKFYYYSFDKTGAYYKTEYFPQLDMLIEFFCEHIHSVPHLQLSKTVNLFFKNFRNIYFIDNDIFQQTTVQNVFMNQFVKICVPMVHSKNIVDLIDYIHTVLQQSIHQSSHQIRSISKLLQTICAHSLNSLFYLEYIIDKYTNSYFAYCLNHQSISDVLRKAIFLIFADIVVAFDLKSVHSRTERMLFVNRCFQKMFLCVYFELFLCEQQKMDSYHCYCCMEEMLSSSNYKFLHSKENSLYSDEVNDILYENKNGEGRQFSFNNGTCYFKGRKLEFSRDSLDQSWLGDLNETTSLMRKMSVNDSPSRSSSGTEMETVQKYFNTSRVRFTFDEGFTVENLLFDRIFNLMLRRSEEKNSILLKKFSIISLYLYHYAYDVDLNDTYEIVNKIYEYYVHCRCDELSLNEFGVGKSFFISLRTFYLYKIITDDVIFTYFDSLFQLNNIVRTVIINEVFAFVKNDLEHIKFDRNNEREDEILNFYYNFLYYSLIKYKRKLLKFDILDTINRLNRIIKKKKIFNESELQMKEKFLKKMYLKLLLKSSNIHDFEKFFKWREFVDCSSVNSFILKKYNYLNSVSVHTSYLLQNSKQAKTFKKSFQQEQFYFQLLLLFCFSSEHNICYNVFHNQLNASKQFEQTFSAATLKLMQDMVINGYINKNSTGFCLLFSHMLLHLCQSWYFTDSILNLSFVIFNLISKSLHKHGKYKKSSLLSYETSEDISSSLEYSIQIEFSAEILAFGDAFTKLYESASNNTISPFNILFYAVLNYVSTFFTVAYKKDKYMEYLNLYLSFLNDVNDTMYDSWIFIQLRKMLTLIFQNITSNITYQDASYFKYYGDFDSGCTHVNMSVLTKIVFSLFECESVNLTEHWTELFTHGHYNVNYDMGYQLIVHYFNGKRYYEKHTARKVSQKTNFKNFILSKIFNLLKNKIYKYLSVEELLIQNNSWFLVNSFVGFLTVFFTCIGDTEFSYSIYKAIEAHFNDSDLLFVRYISKLCDLINQMQLVIIQNESLFQFRIVQFVMNCKQMLNLVDIEFREDANSMINFCCTMVCSQLTLLKGHISMTLMNHINTKNVSIQIPFLLPILYDSEHFTFDDYANIKSKTREEICLLQLSKVINHKQNLTIIKDFLRHIYDDAVLRKKNTYNNEHLKCYYERVGSLSKYLTNMIISQEIKINFSELFKLKNDFVYLILSIENVDIKENFENDEYKKKIVDCCDYLVGELENQPKSEYIYIIEELKKIKESFCAETTDANKKDVEKPKHTFNLIEKYKGFLKNSEEAKSNVYSDEQIIDCLVSNKYSNSNQYNEMVEYIVRESGTFSRNTNYLLNKEGCSLTKFNIFCSLLKFALKRKNFNAADNLLDIIITLNVANENYAVCKLVSICRIFNYNKVYTDKYANHLIKQIAKIEGRKDDLFITKKYVELAKRKLQIENSTEQKNNSYSDFFVNSGSSYSFVLKELKKNKKFMYEKLKFKINANLNEKLEVIKFEGHNLDVQLNARFMTKIATSFKYSTCIDILKIYIEAFSNSKIYKHEEIDMIWLNIVLLLNWYRQNYKSLLQCSSKCDNEEAVVYTYTLRLILKFAIVLLNRAYKHNSTISIMSKIQYLVDFYEFLLFSVNQNVLLCQVIDHLMTIFGLIKSKYELQEQVDVLVNFLLLANENYDKLVKKNSYINKKVRALFIFISRILAESNYLVIDYSYIGKIHEFFIKLSNNYFDKNSVPLILNSNKSTYENYSLFFYFYRCNCKLKDQLEIRENPALSNFYTSFKEYNKRVEEYLLEINKFVNFTNFKRYIKFLSEAEDVSMENSENIYKLLSHFNVYIKFVKREQFQKLLTKLLPKKKEYYYYIEFLVKNKKFKSQHCSSMRLDLISMIDDLSSDNNFISHNSVNKLINSQLFNDVILTKMDNYARIFSWIEKILEAMSRVLNKLNSEHASVVNKTGFFTSLHNTYMQNLCLNYIHFFNIIYQILAAFIKEQYDTDENNLLEKLLNKLCSMLSMHINIDIDRVINGMQYFDDTIKYIKFN